MILKIVKNETVGCNKKYYSPKDGEFEVDDDTAKAILATGLAEVVEGDLAEVALAETEDEDLDYLAAIPEVADMAAPYKSKKKKNRG